MLKINQLPLDKQMFYLDYKSVTELEKEQKTNAAASFACTYKAST